MTHVAVVILNWNGKENTLECLQSLAKLRVTSYELQIIVVDNGSTDGSVAALRKFQILENKENLGFAEGNNVGIRWALKNGADYVLILNNDTIIDENLIEDLLKVAQEHKDEGIFSPKIYFAPGFEFHKKRYQKKDLGKVIWYAGGLLDWHNVLGSNRGVDEVDRGQYSKVEETDFATGACTFVRREIFEKIGFFDKRYFLYLEDIDFSQRAKDKGFGVFYAPPAHLWHKVAQSSAIGSELNDYYITRNRLRFGMKYAPARAKSALIRESARLLFSGRRWQKRGVLDFYLGNFGKGSYK